MQSVPNKPNGIADEALPNPHLPLTYVRLVFTAEADLAGLPAYSGSAWRGAFGHALKRAVCVVRHTPCRACMLWRTCAYPYIFETPPPENSAKLRKYSAAPHPFVLRMPDRFASDRYALGVVLFDQAVRSLPYVIHALEQAALRGIGKAGVRLELREVEQYAFDTGEWQAIHRPGEPLRPLAPSVPELPPLPERLHVALRTPLRLRRDEYYVDADSLRFADFFGGLLRRISLLTYFHGATPLETDFAGLNARAGAVEWRRKAVRWHDWTRYSTRQQTTMQMGGLVGELELDGDALAPFWPYLWLGQWTHAGKGVSMGLGQYDIELEQVRR